MQTYLVRRTGIASARELDAALTRLRSFEETPSAVPARWMHSYALREADRRFGLACVFQAAHVRALQQHAELVRVSATEIVPVTGIDVVRQFAPTMVYLIRRRNAWRTEADLERSTLILRRVGADQLANPVRWMRSYTVREDDGTLGSVCLYQSVDAEALASHAARTGIPADEITPVIGRIVYRDDFAEDRVPVNAALA